MKYRVSKNRENARKYLLFTIKYTIGENKKQSKNKYLTNIYFCLNYWNRYAIWRIWICGSSVNPMGAKCQEELDPSLAIRPKKIFLFPRPGGTPGKSIKGKKRRGESEFLIPPQSFQWFELRNLSTRGPVYPALLLCFFQSSLKKYWL